eukprot:10912961-Karenia_brevis.AAC.1
MARLLAFDGPIMHSDFIRSCHVIEWVQPVHHAYHVDYSCYVRDYNRKKKITVHVHIPLSMYDFALQIIRKGEAYIIGGTLHSLRNQWIFTWTAPKHVCIVSVVMDPPDSPSISVCDLFCGIGAWSVAFQRLKWNIVKAMDID